MKLVVIGLGAEEETVRAALRYFPQARQEELLRCNAEKRAQSVAAEAAVRLEIAHTLHLPREETAILREERGKPYLNGFPSFRFNLSHTEGLAVCAFASVPVGVDAEKLRPIGYSRIAERFFSPREREALAAAKDPICRFFGIWTAKESAVKRGGEGLAGDLRRLDTVGADGISTYFLPPAADRLLPDEENAAYVLSVCAKQPAPPDPVFCSAEALLREWVAFCG